jgi:hypothetical protein
MITKEELNKKLEESLKGLNPEDLKAIERKNIDFLEFALKNYDELTQDAQQMIDKAAQIFRNHIVEVLKELPDNKRKRMLKRLLAGSLGKRLIVEQEVTTLESSPKLREEYSKQFRTIFIPRLQNITDFLFDICENTVSGPANFAQISLLCMCVDELLVTFHLAQHYYMNQAYSHIRTLMEHTDKIELFRVKPEWAKVWCSGDEKKIRKELSPSGVREKLGNSRYDSAYSFLSKLGPHSTFQAVQTKAFRKAKTTPKEKPQIHLRIGGCPTEFHIIFVNGGALFALHLVLLRLLQSFGHFINEEEGKEVFEKNTLETANYLKHYFLPWAKESNLPVKEIEDFLNSDSWGKL